MNPQLIASEVATKVVAETDFLIAIIGFSGVAVGAFVGVAGALLLHWVRSSPRRRLDMQRTKLLITMLDDSRFPNAWRQLSTLARVIGTSEATATRLLIGLGARGSENQDGLWGLIKHHPLNTIGK